MHHTIKCVLLIQHSKGISKFWMRLSLEKVENMSDLEKVVLLSCSVCVNLYDDSLKSYAELSLISPDVLVFARILWGGNY